MRVVDAQVMRTRGRGSPNVQCIYYENYFCPEIEEMKQQQARTVVNNNNFTAPVNGVVGDSVITQRDSSTIGSTNMTYNHHTTSPCHLNEMSSACTHQKDDSVLDVPGMSDEDSANEIFGTCSVTAPSESPFAFENPGRSHGKIQVV